MFFPGKSEPTDFMVMITMRFDDRSFTAKIFHEARHAPGHLLADQRMNRATRLPHGGQVGLPATGPLRVVVSPRLCPTACA